MLREAFPKARLRVRKILLEAFEREGLEYVMCLAGNPTLKRAAAGLQNTSRRNGFLTATLWSEELEAEASGGDAGRSGIAAGRQPKANPRSW